MTSTGDPSNTLVIASDPPEPAERAYEFIAAENPHCDSLLSVTFSQSAQDHHQMLRTQFNRVSPAVGVVSVGEQTRSTAAAAVDSAPLQLAEANWVDTVTPFSLLGVGLSIHKYLEQAITDTSGGALCICPLSTPLTRANVSEVFRFLHLMTEELSSRGVDAYFYLDGEHDDESVYTLLPLFDRVIEVDEHGIVDVKDSLPSYSLEEAEAAIQIDDEAIQSGAAPTDTAMDRLVALTPWLWLMAIATFGFGDIFTTITALQFGLGVEASPIAAEVLAANGLGFIYVVKVALFGLLYLLWRVTPSPHRVGVPLGLSALGVLVVAWNFRVLAIAVL